MFFECVVATIMWELVDRICKFQVNKFEDVATRCLCNKRFLQFNFISSDVLWGIWIFWNQLVLNSVTWIDIKLEVGSSLSEKLESSFQGSVLEGGGSVFKIVKLILTLLRKNPRTAVELKCTSFRWISSWALAAKLGHEGWAPVAYLKDHPEEDVVIHVVSE
jgi:hypothetical protein